MTFDHKTLEATLHAHGTVARIVIISSQGSVPRQTGTEMLVWADGQSGTIGGGRLELEITKRARQNLGSRENYVGTWPLGPSLGQCCGGSVKVLTEFFSVADLPISSPFIRPLPGQHDQPQPVFCETPALQTSKGWIKESSSDHHLPIWIWGAGHVGRALETAISVFDFSAVSWVDFDEKRFPNRYHKSTSKILAAQPEKLVPFCPSDAIHLIVSPEHELDFNLCHTLISHGFSYCGLIGSQTKWTRFRKRLIKLGHTAQNIDKIACPIGDPSLGKAPQAIAAGVACDILRLQAARNRTKEPAHVRSVA